MTKQTEDRQTWRDERMGDGSQLVATNNIQKRYYSASAEKVSPDKRRELGVGYSDTVHVEVRFDDEYGNGYRTLSVTGEVRSLSGKDNIVMCGRIRDVMMAYFPELAEAVRYHLVSTDGPMGYPANALYLAGDRDCWGKRKGEVKTWRLSAKAGNSPITHNLPQGFIKWFQERMVKSGGEGSFAVTSIAHPPSAGYQYAPKWTLTGYTDKWHECPFDTQSEAEEWEEALNKGMVTVDRVPASYGEGKERELDKARSVALWEDATDAELSVEKGELEVRLMERLPAIMTDFRKVVEGLGFDYDFPAKVKRGEEN